MSDMFYTLATILSIVACIFIVIVFTCCGYLLLKKALLVMKNRLKLDGEERGKHERD